MNVTVRSLRVAAMWAIIATVCLSLLDYAASAVIVRAPSPRTAMVGKDPVSIECMHRSTGRELVLGVNLYRKRPYEDSFTLVAQVPNKQYVTLPPTFVDRYLATKGNISTQIKGSFQSVQLSISPVECSDEGTYECEVQVYGGLTPRRPRVIVHLNEEPSLSSLHQSPHILVENYPVTFTCTGSMGRPSSSFKWFIYKNTHQDFVEEVQMSGISSFDRTVGGCSPRGRSTLAVMITRADRRVKCVVQQEANGKLLKVSDEKKLDVQFSVRDTEVSVWVNGQYTNAEEEILVQEGDRIRLSCRSRGNPQPIFSWSYLPLHGQTRRNRLTVLAEKSDLVLSNTTANQSASYVCVTTNFIRGEKQTETKAVRIIIKERRSYGVGKLASRSGINSTVLRYVTIGGVVTGAMVIVLVISFLSVICYRKCTELEDRRYLVKYHGVKA